MNIVKLMEERYSCKKFTGKQIKQEQMDTILEAARLAPTAKNNQPQHIYVIQNQELLEKIDTVTPCRYGAPTCVVITYDKNNVFHYPGNRFDSGAEDIAIVATHMMLAAKSEEVDSCWINFFDPEEMRNILDLPENEAVVLMLDLGYASEEAGPLPNHFASKEISDMVTILK